MKQEGAHGRQVARLVGFEDCGGIGRCACGRVKVRTRIERADSEMMKGVSQAIFVCVCVGGGGVTELQIVVLESHTSQT